MKIVLQRVASASVSTEDGEVARIGRGYLLLVGVMKNDTEDAADRLAKKIAAVRLFDSPEGKINDRSVADIAGEVLVVSQFTLAGSLVKGNRPDYTSSESPERAERLYEYFCERLRIEGVDSVARGVFGAHMKVDLINDGPVTLLLEK